MQRLYCRRQRAIPRIMTTQTGHGQVLSIGAVVADTYQVTRLLGRGGMGAVWEAAHLRLPGKKVAIKVLHADVAADPEALARFRREAEIASRLGHPNIVEVHDFNSLPDGQPYLVLELLIGESLDSRLRRAPVSLDNAMRIAGQIGAALAAAHREQVIHRDLKPHNVFLVRLRDDGDGAGGELVKVLDFGISKIRGSQTIKTLDSTILGTPQYMAPEQATGNHAAVDQRTDVFALGAIVYEMLAGRPAFTGGSIPEVVFKVVYEPHVPLAAQVPGLPRRVADAVDRALAKKQDDRFPDVVSFVEQMAGASISTLRRSPIVAAPPGPGEANPADPLAHTVDSSRRELAPVPEPAEQPVATAETRVPSTSVGPTTGPPRESMAGTSTSTQAEPAARRKLVATAISLLILAGTASGIALMARSSDESTTAVATGPAPSSSDPSSSDPSSSDPSSSDPAPSTSSIPVPAPVPSATPVPRPADVAPGDAADAIEPPANQPQPDRPKQSRPRRPRPAEPDQEPDADVRAQLVAGETALRAGDHRQALVLAERALRGGAGPAAHALRARASCAIGDLGNAKASFVRIPRRNPFLRRRVLSFCTRSGVDLGP
jgi:serine/threonine-protein kinase